MLAMYVFQYAKAQQSDCIPGPVVATTDLPAVVQPFCNASGFNVNASVEHFECDFIDVFVILKARPKLEDTRFLGLAANPSQYFSDVESTMAGGAAEILTFANGSAVFKVWRFRLPVTAGSSPAIFNFPFAFLPNWYFGSCPWRIYVHVEAPDINGNPVYSDNWEDVTPLASPVSTLLFDAPYYPIVGSANVSDHYDNLTYFTADPFGGRAHSIMLLPDAGGGMPVLTVDVPELILGFGTAADRGKLYLSPGAQVKITSGHKLTAAVVDMFTCTQVSKGIVVESGGALDLLEVRFADAEIAVDVKRGAALSSFAGNFTNNYRGIRLDNTGSGSADLTADFVFFNNFVSTGLKPGYSGMPAGITEGHGLEILNHPGIFFSGGSFSGLNTGLRLVRSSLTLRNVAFSQMVTGANTSAPWHGHAIWALGSGVETLDFSHITTPTSPVINGCERRGIYASNMNVTLDKVNTQADNGFFLEKCRMNTVKVVNSPMECRYTAIRTSNCLPVKSGSKIDNNTIEMVNPGKTTAGGAGILLSEASQVTGDGASGWKVTRCTLDLDRTRWGIRYLGSNKTEVSKNEVEFVNSDYPHYVGFDFLNTNNLTVNCNKAFTTIPETQAKGYFIKNVGQSAYTCNEADKINTGMEFSVMCDATVLKGSTYSNSGTGLFLNGDVTLGTQGLDYFDNGNPVLVDDRGNKWSNSNAFHAASQQIVVELSKFGVDPVENPQFKPTSNWQNWFADELTPSIPTFSCTGFNCLPQGPVTPVERSLEKAIADGSIHTSGLPGVIPKMLENHLYARLQENPSWASEAVYQVFLQNKAGTATAAFWQIRQGIDALNNRTATEQSVVAAEESDVSVLRSSLTSMDSIRNTGTAINETQYAQTLAQLASELAGLRAQLGAIRAQKQTLATQLLAQNTAITTSEAWEHTEKKVNELEIQLFIQGDTLYASQLSTLDSIGTLCVHSNGEAVLRAQVLYNLFTEKEYVPVNCTGERDEQKVQIAASALRIYPNPTIGLVYLSGTDVLGCLAEVFDFAGRKVSSVTVSDNSIDLSHLSSGAYFLRLLHPNRGLLASSKIIISK